MIYLIKTNYGVVSLLKIGYTNDLENRLKTYRTHNPRVELISTREGNPELEHFLHEYFVKYSYPNQPEWFYFNDYIVDNFLKINLESHISKEALISILNHKLGLGKQSIKNLENKYIEKYGDEDFQLRKNYLYRFWKDLNDSLSEYSLEGDCPDTVPIDSMITIKDLPFGLGSVSLDFPQIIGRQYFDSNLSESTIEFYCKFNSRNLTQDLIDKKLEATYATIALIENAKGLSRTQGEELGKLSIKTEYYKNRYLSINKDGKFIVNNLVLLAEQRAFDIQKADYSDRFVMFNAIDKP